VKRSKPLSANPEKVREFIARGRGKLKQDREKTAAFVQRGRESGAKVLRESARAGARATARARAGEGPLSPKEWRRAVAEAADLRCTVTRSRAADVFDPSFDAHHALPKEELRARGLGAHVWDPRNGVFVTSRVHLDHAHGPRPRITRELLPARVWEFCAEMDALGAGEWATVMVERDHPAAGSSRTTSPRRTDGEG
jgi:hypothetical protein